MKKPASGIGGKKKPKVHTVQEAAAGTVETVQPSADDDLDISDWLGEEEDSATETKAGETQPLSATPTAETTADHTTTTAEEHPGQEPKGKKEKKEKKPPGTAGRFQDLKKKAAAESSTAAADDVLRQFFGRKG